MSSIEGYFDPLIHVHNNYIHMSKCIHKCVVEQISQGNILCIVDIIAFEVNLIKNI